MKALAAELGPARIRVNSLHPTTVVTPMVDNAAMLALVRPDLAAPRLEDLGEAFRELHLLPEPWVELDDVTNAVLFLVSDEGRCITGQQLKVDLGFCER